MVLTHSTVIRATRERVWALVADPHRQAEWNPKVRVTRRSRTGPAHGGELFSIVGRLGGREQPGDVETLLADAPSHARFRHAVDYNGSRSIAVESYDLVEHRDGVRVTQTIDLTDARIPLFFRVVIRLITLFGRPVGEDPLARLKTLAEENEDARTRPHDTPASPLARPGRVA